MNNNILMDLGLSTVALFVVVVVVVVTVTIQRRRQHKRHNDVDYVIQSLKHVGQGVGQTVAINIQVPLPEEPSVVDRLERKPILRAKSENSLKLKDTDNLLHLTPLKRSPMYGSSPFLSQNITNEDNAKQQIDFSLIWASISNILTVNIFKLHNLSMQHQIILTLQPLVGDGSNKSSNMKAVSSKITSVLPNPMKKKHSQNDSFSQVFCFSSVFLDEVNRCDLLFEIKSVHRCDLRMIGGGGDLRKVGSGTVTLKQLTIKPNVPIITSVNVELINKVNNEGMCRSALQEVRLGQLLMIIECQSNVRVDPFNVKVIVGVKKAEQLIKSTGVYKVELLVTCGEVLLHETTPTSPGSSPVWNYETQFTTHQNKLNNCVIKATIIRVGRTRRSSKVGVVIIGSKSINSDSGTMNWSKATDKLNHEISMWHPIMYLSK